MYIIIIVNGVQHVRHAHLHCAKASRFFDSFGHGNSMQGPQRTPSAINAQDIGWIWMVHSTTMYNHVQPHHTPSPYQSTGLLNTALLRPATSQPSSMRGYLRNVEALDAPSGLRSWLQKGFPICSNKNHRDREQTTKVYRGLLETPYLCENSRSTPSNLRDF